MLAMSRYPQEYVGRCRARFAADTASVAEMRGLVDEIEKRHG